MTGFQVLHWIWNGDAVRFCVKPQIGCVQVNQNQIAQQYSPVKRKQ
ncbi:hypothetical protein RchiOBHm_Chr6g0311001 [Rosa chinensis]|uniref:Uncharacterized protein n=1 Tax=Rosa chinensis TaxID=74649 RepID=A0A2P6Q1B6_ROSCH|nr:hypothetical protein RchiOBHm_Chr6g0311001 [Rosa chinensis]